MKVIDFVNYLIEEMANGNIDKDSEIWCEYDGESGPIESIFSISKHIVHVSQN